VIAVSDTSPVCYLVLIGEIGLLPALFTEVVVPPAVAAELSDPRTPAVVREWWQEPPAWISTLGVGPEFPPDDLRRLHRGERDAILLAERIGADFVLLDEKSGRRAAKSRGLAVMGLPSRS
jgi:predicted nucleic acid-binding protein